MENHITPMWLVPSPIFVRPLPCSASCTAKGLLCSSSANRWVHELFHTFDSRSFASVARLSDSVCDLCSSSTRTHCCTVPKTPTGGSQRTQSSSSSFSFFTTAPPTWLFSLVVASEGPERPIGPRMSSIAPGKPEPDPSLCAAVSSMPAMLARCLLKGLPSTAASSFSASKLVLTGANGPSTGGGVVSRESLTACGVEAADASADLEFFLDSSSPLLLSGSAECWRFSW